MYLKSTIIRIKDYCTIYCIAGCLEHVDDGTLADAAGPKTALSFPWPTYYWDMKIRLRAQSGNAVIVGEMYLGSVESVEKG